MIRIFMVGMSTDRGGVESYIKNLCRHLDPNEFEIIYSWSEMRIDGRKWIQPSSRHNYIKYAAFWHKFFAENKFDVIYFNACDIVSIDLLKFAKAAGVPVRIIHSHSTGNQRGIETQLCLFHRLSEKHSRKILGQYATHLFACSQSAGDWMFDGRPYEIVKNGIQLSEYAFNLKSRERIRASLGLYDESVIGIIGRLSPPKNPFCTLKIVEAFLKGHEKAHAVFVGDGELREEFEASVNASDLSERIHLIGAVDNVNEWMSAVDCILMPSLFEGLPFVLVEAQAAGLPCVVSSTVSEEANITGLVEYVDLESSIDTWIDKISDALCRGRLDVSDKLEAAGYSIENTASHVSKIIKSAERA